MSSHGIDLTSTKRIKFKKLYYNIKSPNYRIDDIRSAIGYNELNYLNKNHKRYLLYKNYLNLIKNSTLSDKVIIPFSEKSFLKIFLPFISFNFKKKNNKKIF